MTKYITVLGGYPDVGKGVFSASIAYLLKQRGNKVNVMKFDGYLNVNSGTMNFDEHSSQFRYNNEEVFVLDDGFCGDLDSGTYERFLDVDLKADHNLTNGIIFSEIIEKEKSKEFPSGKTLEFNDMKKQILEQINKIAHEKDFVIIEVGGTIGDSENEYFIEMLQEMRNKNYDMKFVLLVPIIKFIDVNPKTLISSETKLIRMSIEKLKRKGIKLDAIVCRSHHTDEIYYKNRKSISERCDIPEKKIIIDPSCKVLYELPSILESQRIIQQLFKNQKDVVSDPLKKWVEKFKRIDRQVNIIIFGNTESSGSFISLNEAILHSCVKHSVIPAITWKVRFELNPETNAVILTDGFEDNERLIKNMKNSDIPFLAICSGFKNVIRQFVQEDPDMDMNVCGESKITLLDRNLVSAYKNEVITERYRMNSKTYSRLKCRTLKVFGENEHGPQIVGLEDRFFIATQFHPEYRSRPTKTHPIIDMLIKEAAK